MWIVLLTAGSSWWSWSLRSPRSSWYSCKLFFLLYSLFFSEKTFICSTAIRNIPQYVIIKLLRYYSLSANLKMLAHSCHLFHWIVIILDSNVIIHDFFSLSLFYYMNVFTFIKRKVLCMTQNSDFINADFSNLILVMTVVLMHCACKHDI